MNENRAIYNGFNAGPSFGDDDLKIWGFECYSFKTSYEKQIRNGNYFYVEDCEVFRIA